MDRMNITKKFHIIPLGSKEEINHAYQYIRQAMYVQNKAYNVAVSHAYAAIFRGDAESLAEIYKRASRKPKEDDPDYSLYDVEMFQEIPSGLPLFSNAVYMAKQDMKKAKADGLFKGTVSLQNRRMDAALYVNKRYCQLKHNHGTYNNFIEALYTKDLSVGFEFCQGITFGVVFGSIKKSHELRSVVKNIVEDNYLIQDSKISFDKTGKKIMLHLSLSIPVKERMLDENIKIGVIFGKKVPVVCALNGNKKEYTMIGSIDEINRLKKQIEDRKNRVYRHLQTIPDKDNRKYNALNKIRTCVTNYHNAQNHYMSKKVIDFALSNNAKYIYLQENPDKDESALKEWDYCAFIQKISYKAELYGIEVVLQDIEPNEDDLEFAKSMANI